MTVVRRDRVRQAVSWARMIQDGRWVSPVDEPAPGASEGLRYDYDLIGGLEALIAEGEAGWRRLGAELSVQPYEVVYEDLAEEAGYERAIRGVLDHLGVRFDGAVPAPRTRRQSDDVNEEWTVRFLADRDGADRDG